MDVSVFVMLGAGVFADTLLGRIDSTFINSPDTTPTLSYKIIKNEKKKLHCYPNPSSNVLSINFLSLNTETVKISIIDLTGREVYFKELKKPDQEENTLKLDVSTVTPGSYVLRLLTDASISSEKIVIR